MKSKLLLGLVMILTAFCANGCFWLAFECGRPYKVGSFSGTVLDAETRQPIKGAKVFVEVEYEQFSFDMIIKISFEDDESKTVRKDHYTETDENGRYHLPAFISTHCADCVLCCGGSPKMTMVIYKAGYVGYRNDYIYVGGKAENTRMMPRRDFKRKQNVALLEKWDDKKFTWERDHDYHVDFIRCRSLNFAGKDFCIEAREEMIWGCASSNPKFPTPVDVCRNIVDEQLGLK